jgi:hypothetical protein
VKNELEASVSIVLLPMIEGIRRNITTDCNELVEKHGTGLTWIARECNRGLV